MSNNSNFTKKLKIAFRRWSKQRKAAGWDGISEPFMASAFFVESNIVESCNRGAHNPSGLAFKVIKL